MMNDNDETMIMGAPKYGNTSFSQLIFQSLPYIKKQCAGSKSDLIVFAYEDSFPLQVLNLEQHSHEIKSLILGRHTQCPLRLTDPAVSLRHLVLILYPRNTDFQYQLIDLNSGTGFSVDDKDCRSMWANGASFIRILQYNLLFIVPDQINWDAVDHEIIEQITRRRYEGNAEQRFQPSAVELKPPQHFFTNLENIHNSKEREELEHDITNSISIQLPPVWLDKNTKQLPVVELDIHFQKKKKRILIGAKQLERGVLVGRYDRCGIFFVSDDEYNPISRVHCLFISIDGTKYVIDTASTNGTTVVHEPIQQRILSSTSLVILAESLFISWKEV